MIAIYVSVLVALATIASAGFVPAGGYQAVPAYANVYGAPTTYVAAAPAVSTVHHTPAVSKATRVTSYSTNYPGVPHTVAKVSTYTPAATAVHSVHASVPTAVGGVVHPVPSYGYGHYPARYSYGHPYGYRPLGYGYAHGLVPHGLSYGYGLNPFGYVTPVKK
ncbi:uncharacterized protein [Dermacentor andersoni]|uniref:uncharacterized protein n=1 Tax=Dermacentor andersoni TaxID=34620 RepID=UPI002415B93A|nr:shematrin-like protein 1 [Dermacentor andersoni]